MWGAFAPGFTHRSASGSSARGPACHRLPLAPPYSVTSCSRVPRGRLSSFSSQPWQPLPTYLGLREHLFSFRRHFSGFPGVDGVPPLLTVRFQRPMLDAQVVGHVHSCSVAVLNGKPGMLVNLAFQACRFPGPRHPRFPLQGQHVSALFLLPGSPDFSGTPAF